MTLSIMRDREKTVVLYPLPHLAVRQASSDYLNRPCIRTPEQARRDIERKERIDG